MTIDPLADQVRALRDSDVTGPITMVNLLKFQERARYPDDFTGDAQISGAEAYDRYEHAFSRNLREVSRANVIYSGPVEQIFIGVAGTAETDWDKVLIVRYPDKANFLAMMADADYKQALVHRYAALQRTVLLRCSG